MIQKVVDTLFGSKNEADLKGLLPILHAVNAAEPWAMSLTAAEFLSETARFKKLLADGGPWTPSFPKPLPSSVKQHEERSESGSTTPRYSAE